MRQAYIAGFMIYLVLSLIIIFPMQVSAFSATVTGNDNAENVRTELDITKIDVIAESQVSIEANDGQSYDMECTNYSSVTCSYIFQENTLSPGAHTIILHQQNGTPQTINHKFYVDNIAPEIYSFSAEVVELSHNVSELVGNRLNISINAADPRLTSDEDSCAGIKTISLTTETQTLFEKSITPNCSYFEDELVEIEDVEGDINLILTLTDAVGNTISEQVNGLNVDFKAPELPDDFTILLGEEELTTIADEPQLFPYVDVRFSISESNLSKVFVDASSLTANPAVYPTYTNLEPNCVLQGGKNICTLSNLELNPSTGNIMLSIKATDNNANTAIKNITKTLEVVDTKGEITYFNPLPKHCAEDICYMKKGSNQFQITIDHEEGILPSLITLMTGEISALPKMRVSTCNETITGTHDCMAYLPVTIEESGASKKILLTTPSTDINGNALKGITQTNIIIDTIEPNTTTTPRISDLCPTAGMTANINLTAKEDDSPKLFLTALTNATTGGYNFTNECEKQEDGEFYCEVMLQQFVSYPERENITLVLEDLAGNKQTTEFDLRVCQSESEVAPENIRNIATSTNQKINKRVASVTSTKVFLPLTFQIQSTIAPRMEILAIESDGCLNTEYLAAEPYFINEDSFVRTQEFNANRGEALFVVPIGKQNILDEKIIIDCNLSIYQRVGETRYILPEKQRLKIELETYNNPLGTISNSTAEQLNQIKKELTGIQKDIDSRMKLHSTLESICKIADLLGKVSQAVSVVESAAYIIALAIFPFSGSTSDALWKAVCEVVESFQKVKKTFFKSNSSEDWKSIAPQFLKLGCTLYRCGLCTVDGLMATVNMGFSVSKFLKSDEKKAKLGVETEGYKEEIKEQNKQVSDAKTQVTSDTKKVNDMETAVAEWNKKNPSPALSEGIDDGHQGLIKPTPIIATDSKQTLPPYTSTQIENAKSQLKTSNANYIAIKFDQAKSNSDNSLAISSYNQYLGDSFADSVQRAQEDNSPWILDPYKSKKYASICLCNSGMIYALNKEKQLKCREYKCIENAASQGLPITECQKDYKVANCLYVEGAISKRTLMGQIWEGIKNSLLTDPIKTVRMGVCIDDYLPINTGLGSTSCASVVSDWRTVFCTATDAYLHLRTVESLLSNPFKDAPLEPEGTDYCEGVVAS